MTLKEIKNKILNLSTPSKMRTRVICIDGCAGAGKTTFARVLSKGLDNCPIIHTDDFASWDEPFSWHKRMLEQVLIPLYENRDSFYQKYNWERKELDTWESVSPQKIIIIEGVSSCRENFRPYITFSIFVDTNKELRLKRGLERDGEEAREQWHKWMAEEDEYIKTHNPEGFVNIVINGSSTL